MQLAARRCNFILNLAIGLAVFHRGGNRKSFRAARAFRDEIEELRHPDRPGDARAFLLQIEIGRPKSAVGIRGSHHPITGQRFRSRLLRCHQYDEKSYEQEERNRNSGDNRKLKTMTRLTFRVHGKSILLTVISWRISPDATAVNRSEIILDTEEIKLPAAA